MRFEFDSGSEWMLSVGINTCISCRRDAFLFVGGLRMFSAGELNQSSSKRFRDNFLVWFLKINIVIERLLLDQVVDLLMVNQARNP